MLLPAAIVNRLGLEDVVVLVLLGVASIAAVVAGCPRRWWGTTRKRWGRGGNLTYSLICLVQLHCRVVCVAGLVLLWYL